MKIFLSICTCLLLFHAGAQTTAASREAAYHLFAPLIGTWETKGKWKDGTAYHQEIIVATELTRNIFTAKTQDYIDSKQFDDARRNFGIRAWDKKEQKMKFWEFDVFGGITTGEILFEGRDIYFVYDYPEKDGTPRKMADAWIFVDKDTYSFSIGIFKDGKLDRVFLTSIYKRKYFSNLP